jgi:hypothetical protein
VHPGIVALWIFDPEFVHPQACTINESDLLDSPGFSPAHLDCLSHRCTTSEADIGGIQDSLGLHLSDLRRPSEGPATVLRAFSRVVVKSRLGQVLGRPKHKPVDGNFSETR